MKKLILTAALLGALVASRPAEACTNILVTRGASTDGSTMITYAADYLEQEGSHTGLLVVGAGHMIGSGGIVQGLKDLGYTVEVVPNP